jgi:hypothetical protein
MVKAGGVITGGSVVVGMVDCVVAGGIADTDPTV